MIFKLHDNQLVFSIKDYQGRPYMHFKAYVMWCHDDVRIEHFFRWDWFREPHEWDWLREHQVKSSTRQVELLILKGRTQYKILFREPQVKVSMRQIKPTYMEGRTQYKTMNGEHLVQLSTRQLGVLTYGWKTCTEELWEDQILSKKIRQEVVHFLALIK